jgi:hypothetical protein
MADRWLHGWWVRASLTAERWLGSRRVRWALALAAVLGLGYWFCLRPTTPMTVARAGRLFGQGLRTGQSREEVEAWLTSQGIPPSDRARPRSTNYYVMHRREDVTFKGWWMDCRGSQTVAECAGWTWSKSTRSFGWNTPMPKGNA